MLFILFCCFSHNCYMGTICPYVITNKESRFRNFFKLFYSLSFPFTVTFQNPFLSEPSREMIPSFLFLVQQKD